MWQSEFSILAAASPAAVWRLFSDVAGWPRWNVGIEHITLEGPFASGTQFVMKTPGQPAFTSRLLAVQENLGFTDETVIDDVRVLVDHRIERTDNGCVRITYAATVHGPEAEMIGKAVTEDFPQVLHALATRLRADAPVSRVLSRA
ncbi:SRPBCC family protein [Ideonella azotifigens]|uniref:SRPBCC family protein n=1 Tax=Ideonella azotifigens TaxID=513160 RepID=A0ABN1K794_9BURK|nr:SRPBCC family protein [Ideonella azotifigens]MCD2342234.1 SRPBCC family protein [Ideonella azotifigens]